MAADIVVFDEQEVKDLSTYDKPHQYSAGFQFVVVNGVLVVENGKHTGARAARPSRTRISTLIYNEPGNKKKMAAIPDLCGGRVPRIFLYHYLKTN